MNYQPKFDFKLELQQHFGNMKKLSWSLFCKQRVERIISYYDPPGK